VCANPSFLLVDVAASVRDTANAAAGGYSFLAVYVLAPEKFVAVAAFDEGGLDNDTLIGLIWLGGLLLDLCGVGALVAGLAGGVLPAALAVGYAATALGGLCVIGIVIRGCIEGSFDGIAGASSRIEDDD